VIIVPISRAYRPTRLDGPQFGERVYDRNGDPVATVVGIKRARDLSRSVGLRWTVEGSGVACEKEREFRTVSYRFEIKWRIPRSELQHNCGKVRMLFTRSVVVANGYVPTCPKARSVAQGWSHYQEADNGIHAMIKFSRPVTIRGYRCAAPRSENYTLWVNCRRGRARVYWEWGDWQEEAAVPLSPTPDESRPLLLPRDLSSDGADGLSLCMGSGGGVDASRHMIRAGYQSCGAVD
jgi:hypothetical protein